MSFLKRIFSRKKNRRPFRLTSAGWVFILYTVGVGAGAINTGNNLLYLIFGVFLGLILASGALSDMSLWGLSADIHWPASVVAENATMLPVRVTNGKKRLPSICVTVELQGELRGETVSARAYIPYIPAGGVATAHVVFTPAERGWFQLRTLRFQTSYPFGLLRKRWTAEERDGFNGTPRPASGLFVFPRPLPAAAAQRPPSDTGSNPVDTDTRRGEGDNIYGLREFRESDSPRQIHWKASAKRLAGGSAARPWLVRETEKDQDSEVTLAWNAAAFSALTPAERDTALRFSAGLMEAYNAEGHRVRLALRGDDGGLRFVGAVDGAPSQAWEFVSLWNPGAGPDGTEAYLRAPVAEGRNRSIDVMAAYQQWKGGAS